MDSGDRDIGEDSDDEVPPVLVNIDKIEDTSSDQKIVFSGPNNQNDNFSLPPVPVTILSGFLGSGKTTLIQYILKSPAHGKRIAVIENEFGGGSEGLSVESIIARDGANQESLSDLIELPNGCICCTVKDTLVATLELLLHKRLDLDYILIEASGMANPGPIASLFWLDDALESRLRLHGVVTLVDALNIDMQLKQTTEAIQQIAYADRILLNKVDLVDSDTERGLLKRIRRIHPTAMIRSTTYSRVPDLEWILDTNCFAGSNTSNGVDALLMDSSREAAPSSHVCTDSSCPECEEVRIPHDPVHHRHTEAVGTVALVHMGSVSLRKMNSWLASLLWPNQDEANSVLEARIQEDHAGTDEERSSDDMQIFRIKGILSVAFEKEDKISEETQKDLADENGLDPRRFIVQSVFDLWEIHPAGDELRWDQYGENGDKVERSCKLVVIGRHLHEAKLRDGFTSCFLTGGTD